MERELRRWRRTMNLILLPLKKHCSKLDVRPSRAVSVTLESCMFMLSSLSTKCPLYTSPEQATKRNQRGAGRSERARGDERRTCFHLHGDGVPLALVQQLERDPNVPGRAQPTGSAVRCSTAAEDGAEREHGAAEQRSGLSNPRTRGSRRAAGERRASRHGHARGPRLWLCGGGAPRGQRAQRREKSA